ncbi:MAG: signal recognition particle protein, partial [Coriobacteriia bacterium]|nr:signal recognition particle protein [Coriobacteriia bacterium]
KRLLKAEFTLEDFQSQLGQIKKMGGLGGLLGMLPGAGQLRQLKDQEIDESQLDRINAIIQSMTILERRKPDKINGSRRERIARGAGVSVFDVNQLLKQFQQTKKLMKQFQKQGGKRRGRFSLPPGFGGPA